MLSLLLACVGLNRLDALVSFSRGFPRVALEKLCWLASLSRDVTGKALLCSR